MDEALVICGADPVSDPRPNRMIKALARTHRVTVLCRGSSPLPNVLSITIPAFPKANIAGKILRALLVRCGHLRSTIWPPLLRPLASRLRQQKFAVVIVHDLRLLQVALAIAGRHSRVIFDAREFYPRQYEDLWWWRLTQQPLNYALCRSCLHRASAIVTVSPGLAAEFKSQFGVQCHLMPSLPTARDLEPTPVSAPIKLVHHGIASPSRQLELMIELMDYLPQGYTLDLLLVPTDPAYLARLQKLSSSRPCVRLLPPVPFADLIPFTNSYDIGLFLVPPVSFNLRHALPNKFFEFVQARLMVAIGPSPDMAAFVKRYRLGVVSSEFTPVSLAAEIKKLTPEDIMRFKRNAHTAAAVLNAALTDRMVSALAAGQAPPIIDA
jgi:hypothetical protein